MVYERCSINTEFKSWCLALQGPKFDLRGEIHVYCGLLKKQFRCIPQKLSFGTPARPNPSCNIPLRIFRKTNTWYEDMINGIQVYLASYRKCITWYCPLEEYIKQKMWLKLLFHECTLQPFDGNNVLMRNCRQTPFERLSHRRISKHILRFSTFEYIVT